MANGVFLCNLVAGTKPNSFVPRAYQLVQAMVPKPAIAWSTTDGAATTPRAFGCIAGATSQQIVDINADAVCWTRELPANWRTLAWSNVPSAQRNRVTTILGVDPNIALTDLLPVAFDKILAAMNDRSVQTLADLELLLGQPL